MCTVDLLQDLGSWIFLIPVRFNKFCHSLIDAGHKDLVDGYVHWLDACLYRGMVVHQTLFHF